MPAERRALVGLVALLALPGCPGGECSVDWGPTFDQLDRSVLSVNGRGDDDVWMVGGGVGVDVAALAMHWDGSAWNQVDTGHHETLWWVWLDPTGDAAWMVGEDGLVLRWSNGSVDVLPTDTSATLYGVWGAAGDDVWIVGGTVGAGFSTDNDVVLHWDGATLSRDDTRPARGAVLFKAWGASADDLWVSGEHGTMLHRTAAGWDDLSDQLATQASLLTVHGCSADEVYAVGGRALYAWDGSSWAARDDVDPPSFLNGVSCGDAAVLAVGNGGARVRLDRDAGTWIDDQFADPWDTDYHGAWVSPTGNLWAVGGNFLLPPGTAPRTGVVAFRGCPRPPGD